MFSLKSSNFLNWEWGQMVSTEKGPGEDSWEEALTYHCVNSSRDKSSIQLPIKDAVLPEKEVMERIERPMNDTCLFLISLQMCLKNKTKE